MRWTGGERLWVKVQHPVIAAFGLEPIADDPCIVQGRCGLGNGWLRAANRGQVLLTGTNSTAEEVDYLRRSRAECLMVF